MRCLKIRRLKKPIWAADGFRSLDFGLLIDERVVIDFNSFDYLSIAEFALNAELATRNFIVKQKGIPFFINGMPFFLNYKLWLRPL